MRIDYNMQFLAALGFYEHGLNTARKINLSLQNDSFNITPVAAVNLSFSAELFLKLLYLFEFNKTINEHRLDKIFNKFSIELQLEIENKYLLNKKNSNNDLYPVKLVFNADYDDPHHRKDDNDITNLTLEKLLKIHSNGFVSWRYAYETKDECYSYEFNFNLMNEFIKSLISIIKLHHMDKFHLS